MTWGKAGMAEGSARQTPARARQAAVADGTAALPCPPTLGCRPEGDRVVVTIRGEVDRDAAGVLGRTLDDALRRAGQGVDLDLGDVAFWDCSSLNVLLELRRRALRSGKDVAIRAAHPTVDRVLELTGTVDLFVPSAART
ncbi:STAS domain-containing protein [Streptomyces sp. NPDC046831]|uniref:STAS domain-containing protein n=1 Tax=Streptomyces sp. NPDC046831 TaxID=3154805 RepID=UPI0033C491A9